jgi:DtxR family Mn-dependent transcriptional regulator
VRRHRLAERLLVDVIGLEWEKVHREADRWEHAISTDVEEKLVLLLGDPATCPHGNPIPGSKNAGRAYATMALSQAPTGPITVRRVSERLETDDDGLRLIATAHLLPGSEATVIDSREGAVTVKTETGEHEVPRKVADHMHISVGT